MCISVTLSCHGALVKQRLSESPRIYFLPNFLSDKECDYLINSARDQLDRSRVIAESGSKNMNVLDNRRTSSGAFLPYGRDDAMIQKIEQRIAEVTHYPVENGEALHVLRYKKGQEYQPHWDYFPRETPAGAAALERGGQRVATLIMYLSEPKEGGETIFPRVKLTVTPIKGSAVLFFNCLEDGNEDPRTLHGGAPVKAGVKWIATKWIREKLFK